MTSSEGQNISSPVDLCISVLKPMHARWIINSFDTVSKDKALHHAWISGGETDLCNL